MIKDLPRKLIQSNDFSAFKGLDGEAYKRSVCINYFTLKIKLGRSLCLSFEAMCHIVITLLIFFALNYFSRKIGRASCRERVSSPV